MEGAISLEERRSSKNNFDQETNSAASNNASEPSIRAILNVVLEEKAVLETRLQTTLQVRQNGKRRDTPSL